MNCVALPHALWTQSLQRLKIKWTNPQKGKNNAERHYKRQHLVRMCLNCTLLEAGGVSGRTTAYFHAWISHLPRKGSCRTTLRKPKSPLWKGGPRGENPSDYVQQMEKGGGSKAYESLSSAGRAPHTAPSSALPTNRAAQRPRPGLQVPEILHLRLPPAATLYRQLS